MTTTRKIYRILDANFNRSREGLRVCEEVVRFVLEEASLTRELKSCRHAISDIWKKLLERDPAILKSRDALHDVGSEASKVENSRADFKSLFAANSQRVKESLRTLEETIKLVEPNDAKIFKRIRFRVYTIEKKVLPKLAALRDHVSRVSRRPVPKRARA